MSDILDALVREHAQKYDPAVLDTGEVAAPSGGSADSLYYQDLAARAQNQKTTVSELLVRDRELLASNTFPSPKCLRPDEVGLAVLERLVGARRQHYDECLYCQALIARARVGDRAKAELLRGLAVRAAQTIGAAAPETETERETVLDSLTRFLGTLYRPTEKAFAFAAAFAMIVLVAFQPARLMVANLMMRSGNGSLIDTKTRLVRSDAETRLAAAVESSARGDDSKVIELTTAVLNADPSNAGALWLRGQTLLKEGKHELAKADFGSLFQADPTNSFAANVYSSLNEGSFLASIGGFSTSSRHPGGFNVGMADGSVKFIKNSINFYGGGFPVYNGNVSLSSITDGTSNTIVYGEGLPVYDGALNTTVWSTFGWPTYGSMYPMNNQSAFWPQWMGMQWGFSGGPAGQAATPAGDAAKVKPELPNLPTSAFDGSASAGAVKKDN